MSSPIPESKKFLPNTSVAAVPYRKNSYHSTTDPAIEAATTLFNPYAADGSPFANESTSSDSCWLLIGRDADRANCVETTLLPNEILETPGLTSNRQTHTMPFQICIPERCLITSCRQGTRQFKTGTSDEIETERPSVHDLQHYWKITKLSLLQNGFP